MTFTYNTNIPFATNNPSTDQPNMQTNTNSISGLIGIDHFGFNAQYNSIANSGGFHKVVHMTPFSTISGPNNPNPPNNNPPLVPTPIGLIGQLFSVQMNNGIAPDEALFFLTGGGVLNQLTVPGLTPSANTNGYTYLAGGLIIQWGRVSMSFSSGSTTGTVTFATANIAFPNNCFVVTGNPLVSFGSLPSSQASVNIRQSTVSKTSFDWQFYTNSSQYIGFFWMAIGN